MSLDSVIHSCPFVHQNDKTGSESPARCSSAAAPCGSGGVRLSAAELVEETGGGNALILQRLTLMLLKATEQMQSCIDLVFNFNFAHD